MNGLLGTAQLHRLAQFLEGHIRLAAQQFPQPLPMLGHQDWLSPGITVAGTNVTGPAALLEELFDHAQ